MAELRAPPYISVMTAKQTPLPARRALRTIAAAVLALLALSAPESLAVEIGSGNGLNSSDNADIHALQNRLQRQQYQQLQQLQREQDRLTVQQPQPRLEVPRVKPSCQVQIYGNRTVTNCR